MLFIITGVSFADFVNLFDVEIVFLDFGVCVKDWKSQFGLTLLHISIQMCTKPFIRKFIKDFECTGKGKININGWESGRLYRPPTGVFRFHRPSTRKTGEGCHTVGGRGCAQEHDKY